MWHKLTSHLIFNHACSLVFYVLLANGICISMKNLNFIKIFSCFLFLRMKFVNQNERYIAIHNFLKNHCQEIESYSMVQEFTNFIHFRQPSLPYIGIWYANSRSSSSSSLWLKIDFFSFIYYALRSGLLLNKKKCSSWLMMKLFYSENCRNFVENKLSAIFHEIV